MTRRRAPTRGAALLLAMIILTLVTTLAAGMVWQQWRATEVEAAERARMQATWILNGALDWARAILRDDLRGKKIDHLGEPWAVPLAEARLSTFLAADRNNASEEDGIEAFLSGGIQDAQSRFNLHNLVNGTQISTVHVEILRRLCAAVGLTPGIADTVAQGMLDAINGDSNAAIPPNTVAQLAWLGLDVATVERLAPWVEMLPESTPINVNTASREVIAAVWNLDLNSAQRLVQHRERNPFESLADTAQVLGPAVPLDPQLGDVISRFFVVRARLRLGDRVQEEETLVRRRSAQDVTAVRRQRINQHLGGQ